MKGLWESYTKVGRGWICIDSRKVQFFERLTQAGRDEREREVEDNCLLEEELNDWEYVGVRVPCATLER